MDTIGYRLKMLRTAKGYSAEQVAEMIKINPATMYRYENGGISKMPSYLLRPLAEILGTTPAYIMGWSDESTQETLTEEERIILDLYRGADPVYRSVTIEILRSHQSTE